MAYNIESIGRGDFVQIEGETWIQVTSTDFEENTVQGVDSFGHQYDEDCGFVTDLKLESEITQAEWLGG